MPTAPTTAPAAKPRGTAAFLKVPPHFERYAAQLRRGELLGPADQVEFFKAFAACRMDTRRAVRDHLRRAAIEGRIEGADKVSTIRNASVKNVGALIIAEDSPKTRRELKRAIAERTQTQQQLGAEVTALNQRSENDPEAARVLRARIEEHDTVGKEIEQLEALLLAVRAARGQYGPGQLGIYFKCGLAGGVPNLAGATTSIGVAARLPSPDGRVSDVFVKAGGAALGFGAGGVQGLVKDADGKRRRGHTVSVGPVQVGDPYLGPKITPSVGTVGIVLTTNGVGASFEPLNWLPWLAPLARIQIEGVITHPLLQPAAAAAEKGLLGAIDSLSKPLEVPGLPKHAEPMLGLETYRDLDEVVHAAKATAKVAIDEAKARSRAGLAAPGLIQKHDPIMGLEPMLELDELRNKAAVAAKEALHRAVEGQRAPGMPTATVAPLQLPEAPPADPSKPSPQQKLSAAVAKTTEAAIVKGEDFSDYVADLKLDVPGLTGRSN